MEYHDSTEFEWKDDSYVLLKKIGINTIELQANVAGLLSLADQLSQIAKGGYGSVFYDTDPGDLEDGSIQLQITKVNMHGRSLPINKTGDGLRES